VSAFSGATMGFQTSVVSGRKASGEGIRSSSLGVVAPGLSERDINERVRNSHTHYCSFFLDILPLQISKAVEMEVARRLEERERERVEAERQSKEDLDESTPIKASSPKKGSKKILPSGVLTPLLKRHQDLDDELKSRLRELEQKLYVTTHIILPGTHPLLFFLAANEATRKSNWPKSFRLCQRKRQVVLMWRLHELTLRSLC
jgi:hypothetical protein